MLENMNSKDKSPDRLKEDYRQQKKKKEKKEK